MPTGMNAASPTPNGQYIPPKDWDDITSDEKIERLREIIKSLTGQIGRTQTDIHHVRENFKNHSHGDKGILVPFNEYGSNSLNGIATASLSNAKYF